ncbi:MAG: flavin reductase family protein [Pseudomonadota bacterium]
MQHAGFDGFAPSNETSRPFRDALGRFASGVTVITTASEMGGIGMTANSFSSVSMEPPLVMWCPAKSSSRFPVYAQASRFSIHVLAAEQEHVARAFAASGAAFDTVEHRHTVDGVPVFDDCLARFDCATHALHDAGDHIIMLGRVLEARFRNGTPLIFSQGAFRRFDNEA